MVKPSKLAAATAAAALLLAAASPAAARPGSWRSHDRGWHHRGGGVSFGDVLLGAVIVGGVAAVANGVANGSRDRDRGGDYGDYGASVDDGGSGWSGDRYENGAPRADRGGQPSAEEDAAVERCADAAGAEMGGGARVRGIRYVDRDGAGWRVEGDVAEERGYVRSFVCGVRSGAVEFVQLGENVAAR